MSKKEENKPPNRKLILYFDLNKTILLQDTVKEVSKDDNLHIILASYAWGRLEQKDEKSPVQWKLYSNHFSKQSPEKDMIDYRTYVESLFPLKTDKEDPDIERRKIFNKQMKQNRIGLYLNLVKTGGPGIKLKPEYDRIMKTVTLPKLVAEYVKNELAREVHEEENAQSQAAFQAAEEEKIFDLLADGKFNIIPSFFKTMINLKKQKREFSVVFRTFGADLPDVNREINAFCAGEHPCFNGRNNMPIVKFDGSKNNKSFQIKGLHTGVFYRNNSEDVSKVQLALGTTKVCVLPKANIKDFYAEEIKAQTVKIVEGAQQIHAITQELLKETCALSFIDDKQTWTNLEQKSTASKLLIIDQSDYFTQHIFFDDKSTPEDTTVVDVRDLVTGEPISIKRSFNRFQVKVDIIEVIRDPDFFLKAIDICEKARVDEIERVEKQLPLEDIDPQSVPVKKSDFQILQESEAQHYLRKTILPLLNPALRICDLERPIDPITFIALFCLKNKERVKIPVPPPEFYDKDKIEEGEQEEGLQTDGQQATEDKKEVK